MKPKSNQTKLEVKTEQNQIKSNQIKSNQPGGETCPEQIKSNETNLEVKIE